MRKSDIPSALFDPLVALVLLTRLPMPRLPARAFERQAQAGWSYPLAGLAIGLPACLLGALALGAELDPQVAAGLALALMVLLSGAMHEDGLADSADGLWGGNTPERRLEIMKDSRIGSYGVLALVLGTGLRWSLLSALLAGGHVMAAAVLAGMSRAAMPVLMMALPHARSGGLSRSVGRPGATTATFALGIALMIALIWTPLGWSGAICLLVAGVGLPMIVVGTIAWRKIGGQTGDILGASQQISEIALGCVLLALL